jgi:hypothetical protein
MSDRLHDLLFEHSHAMVEHLVRQLRAAPQTHYRRLTPGLLSGRTVELVGTFVESIRRDLLPFVAYVQEIVEERILEGFSLGEIQHALSLLEDFAWQLVIDHSPPELQVEQLRRISCTVGAAKDQLARVYLRHMERAEARAAGLERRLEQLFKGTDPPPEE